MPCILAIDGGSRTGFALWKPGLAKPRAGAVVLPEMVKMGPWAAAFIDWMLPFARLEQVTHVVCEAPIISDHGGAGVNMDSVRKLVSIVSFAEYAAHLAGAEARRVPRSTVLKHFVGFGAGKRKELKAACIVRCQAKGWVTHDEDIADALACLDWYAHDLAAETPWDCTPAAGPLFT